MSTTHVSPLIDIGVNLGHRSFARDRSAVLARARAAGVVQQVVTGTSTEGSRSAVGLAREHPGLLFATAGIHPHSASELNASSIATLRELREREASPVVAIGECGLDYDRDFSPRPVQRRCFAAQLALAAELALPVFLHEREAHEDFAAILREHRASLTGAVLHCFTGGRAQLGAYLELGCHIGITGWIADERRGAALRETVPAIPAGRLMLETDAPFLLPRSAPKSVGRRNEPAFLPLVLAAVAAVTGRDARELALDTTRTAQRFFGLPAATLEMATAAGEL
ncbi:MAG: TatD family hydrolase [Myxococcales bacterium]|nr:TatD family hydrolase [Myxococcales bacterium]